MKKSTLIKHGIALSVLTSTLLHATNGDHLISVGTKARGMGGVGIALSHGAESALNNPALITAVENTEVSFGGTIFMPDISTTLQGSMLPPQTHTSDADINLIPEVSIAQKVTENFYVGIGMWGTAGMGTDYSKATMDPSMGQLGNFNMVTNLQLMQFAVPLAYKMYSFSIAIAPIVQYGNLDMNYVFPGMGNVGSGLAQDFGFGFSAGASYNFNNGLTLGAVYKSAIEMEYEGQLSTATAPFVAMGAFPAPMSDVLEQPAEIGIGLAYIMDQHTFAFDYKRIQWSDATGYSDFGWEDQDVFAFGYEYSQDNWALRAGYNYASSAVVELSGATTMQGVGAQSAINFFNLLGFPATAEQHYTVGGTYEFNEQFSVDLAYVYSPVNTETFDTPAFAAMGIESLSTDHREDSLSFQLTYKF